MKFENVLLLIKHGVAVRRRTWENTYIVLLKFNDIQNSLKMGYGEYVNEPFIQSSIAIVKNTNDKTPQLDFGWCASTEDILADDWESFRVEGLTFEEAKMLLIYNMKVSRKTWEKSGKYLIYLNNSNAPNFQFIEHNILINEPCTKIFNLWEPTHEDKNACDWQLVGE